jgi:hypothetical protein
VKTLFLILLILGAGCTGLKPQKGGRMRGGMNSSGVITNLVVEQGENAQTPTTQAQETETQESYTVPAGSVWVITAEPEMESAAKGYETNRPGARVILSEPMPVVRRVSTKNASTLGAAQKDMSRELAAKFADMKPVQFVGIALLLAAGAFVYFGWHTPAMIAAASGLGMIVMAHSIVGNERLITILLIVALTILVVFHAYNKGKLDHILPDKLDRFPHPPEPRL